MSRGFGSTFGAGTGDIITVSGAFTASTSISFSCWVYINGVGGSNLGTIYTANGGGANNFLGVEMNNTTSVMLFFAPWSTTSGRFTWTAPSLNRWHHLLITYSGSSTSNKPTVYLDGVSVAVTAGVIPAGTYGIPVTSMIVGNIASLIRNWDGMLSGFSFWNGTVLAAADALALASGTHPLAINPQYLAIATQLDGVNNPEPSYIGAPSISLSGTRLGSSEPQAEPWYGEDDITLFGTIVAVIARTVNKWFSLDGL